jgi:hypothetical protein
MKLFFYLTLLGQARVNGPRPGDWGFGWLSVGIIAAGALAIILAAWVVLRWLSFRESNLTHSPWRLYQDLCAAHGLSHRERQLLLRLARGFRLEQPAVLFVEPAWWDAERLGASFGSQLSALDKLRKKLFAVR